MRLYAVCLSAMMLGLSASSACAGAWTQNPGDKQLILTGRNYSASHFYDNSGNRHSQPTYQQYELNPYFEYGLWNGTTLGASLSLQHTHQADGLGNNWGIGDSEFFLRQRLWQKNGFSVSVEPMIKLPSPGSSTAIPQIGSSHPDAGMGLAAGYGFSTGTLNHFAELTSQYRYRFGPEKDQVRLSATAGISLSPRWMVMPQAFLIYRTATPTMPAFTESPNDDYNEVRLQLSGVYKINEGLSLQLGAFSDVDGKNTGDGKGVLFAVWKHL